MVPVFGRREQFGFLLFLGGREQEVWAPTGERTGCVGSPFCGGRQGGRVPRFGEGDRLPGISLGRGSKTPGLCPWGSRLLGFPLGVGSRMPGFPFLSGGDLTSGPFLGVQDGWGSVGRMWMPGLSFG